MEEIKKELNKIDVDLFDYMEKDPYNYFGILSGAPGNGVGFITKYEILKTYLNTQDDIVVFDCDGEFAKGFSSLNDCSIINFNYPKKFHINPLDLAEDVDPHEQFERKVILFKAFYETISNRKCNDTEEYNIKKALATVYKEVESPKLIDLYNILEKNEETKFLADAMLVYSTGNMDILSQSSNVHYNRITFFELNHLRGDMQNLVMLSVLENLNKKVLENVKNGKKTWIFINDITTFLSFKGDKQYILNLVKRARLYGVKIIGITRNISDLLTNEEARPIITNIYSLELLNHSAFDRNLLRNIYNFSNAETDLITNAEMCTGLLCTGSKRQPFEIKLDKDTNFYKQMIAMPF